MTNNGSPNPYLTNPNGQDFKPSSGISFTKDELTKASTKIADPTEQVSVLSGKSNDLHVPFPAFGVIGMGIQSVHEKAIQSQREALEKARVALESYDPALRDADRNYKTVDDDPDPYKQINGPGDLGNLKNPGLPGGGDVPGMKDVNLPKTPNGTLPDGKLPDGKLPDGTLPNGTLPDGKLPDGKLPDSNLPGSDLPGSDLPGTDKPSTDLPNADLPNANLPNADLPNADLPQQKLPTTDPADMKVPDIDSALNNPAKTDLSSYQPTPPPQIGSNLPGVDPASPQTTRTGPGSISVPGTGTGMGIGANGGPPGTTAAGLRGVGAGGAPMMPFMPMGGAGMGGEQGRDRENTIALAEDEGVWGGDEDVAPQVIGLEE